MLKISHRLGKVVFRLNDFEEPIHINIISIHYVIMWMPYTWSTDVTCIPAWRSSSSQSLHGTPWRFRQCLQDGLGVKTMKRYGWHLESHGKSQFPFFAPEFRVMVPTKHPCSLTNRLDPGGNRHKTWLFWKAFPSCFWCQDLAQTN